MSDETEVPEEEAEEEYESGDMEESYFGRIGVAEMRRYVAIDICKCFGVSAKDLIKQAGTVERFLVGKSLREVTND